MAEMAEDVMLLRRFLSGPSRVDHCSWLWHFSQDPVTPKPSAVNAMTFQQRSYFSTTEPDDRPNLTTDAQHQCETAHSPWCEK